MDEALTVEARTAAANKSECRKVVLCRLGQALFVVSACVLSVVVYEAARPRDKTSAAPPPPAPAPLPPKPSNKLPAVPVGVNFGGWLCLEDWFYSGDAGRNVMSVTPAGQGQCLPPEVATLSEPWPSEGILTKRLNDSLGPARAVAVLEAHRHSFIGNSDLEDVASLGIQKIRLPLTWGAFADALKPIDADTYGAHDADKDTIIVPDPFYAGIAALATIPRGWLAQFLHKAASSNLTVLLDLHAFPGGAQDGTYNGVWPSKPAFWRERSNIGNRSVALSDAGLWIVQALVQWVEGLDPEAQRAVAGVTLMNEPAHMAAPDSQDPTKDFADEDQILAWLEAAANIYRQSSLSSKGIRLYMQMIQTAFKDFEGTVVPWYNRVFSEQERQTWAVMDIHWYTAWDNGCSGRTEETGAYLCDQPLDEISQVLQRCAGGFAQSFANMFPGLRATSEFSMGTFQDAWLACNDPSVLALFLQEQVKAFSDAGIEGYFWSWRMPFGQVFEPGWSLKRMAGLEKPRPVELCLPNAVRLTV